MSQREEQPSRSHHGDRKPIKYGDVFPQVSGELATKAVTPGDAAAVKAAEMNAIGWNPSGGAAAVMESAAAENQTAGLPENESYLGGEEGQGVDISETFYSGNRVIRESLHGQVVQNILEPQIVRRFTGGVVLDSDPITIGEALEATAFSAPDKLIDKSDAAAIQAAESLATGINSVRDGDVAAVALSAAEINGNTTQSHNTVTLYDVLVNARSRMVADKVVTMEDAKRVIDAEVRDKPTGPFPGGVGASIIVAAQINQSNFNNS